MSLLMFLVVALGILAWAHTGWVAALMTVVATLVAAAIFALLAVFFPSGRQW